MYLNRYRRKERTKMNNTPIVFIDDMTPEARAAVRKFNEASYRINKLAQAIPAVENEETKRSLEGEIMEVIKTYAKTILTAKEVTQEDFEAVS